MPLIETLKTTRGSEVLIWRLDEPFEALLGYVGIDIAPLSGIQHLAKKMEWLGARLLVQQKFGNNEKLLKAKNGAPYLANRNVEISLTHSFPFVGLMVSEAKSCGIDIEKPRPTVRRVHHKFLSGAEQNLIGDDLKRLTLAWSAKEVGFKIYKDGAVHFIENMKINAMNGEESGTIDLKFENDHRDFQTQLQYHSIQGHVLVFGQLP